VASTQLGKEWPDNAGQQRPLGKIVVHAAHGHVEQLGAGAYFSQVPATQTSSTEQTFPHAPQFVGSFRTLTHEFVPPPEAHAVVPLGHAATHALPAQAFVPPLHKLPHEPQLATSEVVLTHEVPHFVSPGRHVHPPARQYSSGAHETPQPPQSFEPSLVTVHSPPHTASPVLHAQLPEAHATEYFTSDEQTLPQPPQLFMSFAVFTHAVPHVVNVQPASGGRVSGIAVSGMAVSGRFVSVGAVSGGTVVSTTSLSRSIAPESADASPSTLVSTPPSSSSVEPPSPLLSTQPPSPAIQSETREAARYLIRIF